VIRTRASAVIPAMPGAVYALLDDPQRAAELASNRVEVLRSEEMADGSRVTRIRTHLPNGAIAEAESTVVERVPDKRMVVVATTSPFGFAPTARLRFGRVVTRTTRTLAPHPDGTQLTVESELRISPALLRLYFAFVKRGQWQRATDDWLERVRAEFESSSDHPR
jgi:hypothetical protein